MHYLKLMNPTPKCFLYGLVVVILMTYVKRLDGQHLANQREKHFQLRMSEVKKMARLMKQNSGIALIKFNTTTKKTTIGFADPKRPIEQILMPLTFVALDEADEWRIYIDGEFTLLERFQGQLPRLGRRTASVKIKGNVVFRHPDPTFERLQPLTSQGWDLRNGIKYLPVVTDRKPKELLLLAVWSSKAKCVSEGTFFGPLTESDGKYLSISAKWLAKTPWPSIDLKNAVRLLHSSNPWELNIALTRLEELKELHARHFSKAVLSASIENLQLIVSDMFLTARSGNKKVQKGLTKELSTFFANTKPAKQNRILKAVNEALRHEWNQRLVDLPALRNAARKYRRQIENDPARREVLREIDALLKIRGKVIAL